MNRTSQSSLHAQFEELLTPYVQNRLDEETRRKLEHYAESSSDFAEMLEFEKRIAASVRTEAPATVATLPSIHKLKQRIEAEAHSRNAFRQFLATLHDALSGPYAGAMKAAVAVAVVATLTLIALPRLAIDSGDSYSTLSNGESAVSPSVGQQYYRVVFREEIGRDDIDRLARELGFGIEKGPDTIGSYVVGIDANTNDGRDILSVWRSDDRFVLVEPVLEPQTAP